MMTGVYRAQNYIVIGVTHHYDFDNIKLISLKLVFITYSNNSQIYI